MTKREKIYAIDALEEMINSYVYDYKARKFEDKQTEKIINSCIGATYYAYFIDIIEKEQLKKYISCIKMHRYTGE